MMITRVRSSGFSNTKLLGKGRTKYQEKRMLLIAVSIPAGQRANRVAMSNAGKPSANGPAPGAKASTTARPAIASAVHSNPNTSCVTHAGA